MTEPVTAMKADPVLQSKIVDALRGVGLQSGDTVLVHNDTSRLMKLAGSEWWEDAFSLLHSSFETVLDQAGTLVVPTFNYEFCRGKPYDHVRTPSQVGLFTNYIRRDARAIRSLNPIFSFAAIGSKAIALCENVSHSSFGADSVFDRLYHLNAKLVFFDTSIESCTFIHYVEQALNVEYRFLKYFTGEIRLDGQRYIDTFDFFVRYQNKGIKTVMTPLAEWLQRLGLLQQVDVDGIRILQVAAKDFEHIAREAWLQDRYAFLAAPPDQPLVDAPNYSVVSQRAATASATNLPATPLKSIVAKLHPLHRTLVSDGSDAALEIIGSCVPASAAYSIESYPPTRRMWTWRVPERYVVHEAFLETEDGQKILDFKDNPLHLVSYSVAIEKVLSWAELEPHLFYSVQRPSAIPWIFKYYERSWGFCLSKTQFDTLPRHIKYRVVIRSEFKLEPDLGLRVGLATIAGQTEADDNRGEFIVSAHSCHPGQSNDDAAGVAVSVEVLRRLSQTPLPAASMRVRFLYGPETIGTVCYLAAHEDLIATARGAIFVEMPGNRNMLALQRTRQDSHVLDRVARHVLRRLGREFREGAFRDVIRNDEMVLNGPGVNIPCISLSRWPYDEYHTSDDNDSIIHEDMLEEAATVVEGIVRIFASNYVPVRTFVGPVFLSGYGLHVDQRKNRNLNRAIEKIMLCLEGQHSIFDIAEQLAMDYWEVRDFIEMFRARGLIRIAK